MIPESFDYLRAFSVDEALTMLRDAGPDAKLVAGGHSLLPLMKLRIAQPSALVDIRGLPDLTAVSESAGVLHVGAGVRHRELASNSLVWRLAPLMSTAAGTIGDRQVRSRGTIGGSIAHADPAADLPAVLLALDATILVRGLGGDREIPAADFFLDFWTTALAPDEMIIEIRVPSTEGQPYSYQKFRQRRQDWATVSVAVVGGEQTRVALANMAMTPVRARGVEDALAAGAYASEAAARADEATSPPSDLRADGEYRRHLSRILVRDALTAMAGSPA